MGLPLLDREAYLAAEQIKADYLEAKRKILEFVDPEVDPAQYELMGTLSPVNSQKPLILIFSDAPHRKIPTTCLVLIYQDDKLTLIKPGHNDLRIWFDREPGLPDLEILIYGVSSKIVYGTGTDYEEMWQWGNLQRSTSPRSRDHGHLRYTQAQAVLTPIAATLSPEK